VCDAPAGKTIRDCRAPTMTRAVGFSTVNLAKVRYLHG
jgi:hypothetical protein